MEARLKTTGALLASPVFAACIGLLLLNDRVLKAAWPGLVTGKLSDIAGVAMVAIVIAAIARRVDVAIAATAIGFTLLKLVPSVAKAAAPVLGGVTRTDPTDLAALLVLFPLARWMCEASRARRRFDPAWLLPLQVALMSTAVFATTATSCGGPDMSTVVDRDGILYVRGPASEVYESTDHGKNWESADGQSGLLPGDLPNDQPDCEADTCYRSSRRTDGSTVVEAVRGLDVAELLLVSAQDWQVFAELEPYVDCAGQGDVLVSSFERSDGEHVAVSVGAMGLLIQGPEGDWFWAAIGDWGIEPNEVDREPLGVAIASFATSPGTAPGVWIGRLALIGVAVATVLSLIPMRRLAVRKGRGTSGATVAVLGWATVPAFFAATLVLGSLDERENGFFGFMMTGFAVSLAVASVIALAIIGGVVGRRKKGEPFAAPNSSHRVG